MVFICSQLTSVSIELSSLCTAHVKIIFILTALISMYVDGVETLWLWYILSCSNYTMDMLIVTSSLATWLLADVSGVRKSELLTCSHGRLFFNISCVRSLPNLILAERNCDWPMGRNWENRERREYSDPKTFLFLLDIKFLWPKLVDSLGEFRIEWCYIICCIFWFLESKKIENTEISWLYLV